MSDGCRIISDLMDNVFLRGCRDNIPTQWTMFCRIACGAMEEVFRRTGRPADTLVYKSHTHAYVCIVLRKGCPPVRLVYPLPSILRFALTSSMPLSRTNHPRVRAFPIRLLWKPACCSTIPKRLILIGFLMEPQETSLSEISAVVMNRPSPARGMSK